MKAARLCRIAVIFPLLLMTSCALLRRDGDDPGGEFEVDDPNAPEIVMPEDEGESTPDGADVAEAEPTSDGEVEVAEMKIRVGRRTRTVSFRLRADAAPQTVANFRKLVDSGFYRGVAFHRAIPGFLVQTGDPLTREEDQRGEWGTGGPGYTIPAEIELDHERGSVAMARLKDSVNPDRESSGSQFYFALTELPELDGEYTVFGEVINGIDVLDEISRAVVDTNDAPVERFEIKSIEIRRVSERRARMAGDEVRDSEVGGRRKSRGSADRGPFTRFLERYW